MVELCLAVPGKVVSVKGDVAEIVYGRLRKTARVVSVKAKKGDWVVVRGGVIVQRMDENEAKRITAAFG